MTVDPRMIEQLAYKILNAPLQTYPYPHIYVPDVFPAEVYAELQRRLPNHDAMIPIEKARPVKGYKERFVREIGGNLEGLTSEEQTFWREMARSLLGGRFLNMMIQRFRPYIDQRFAGRKDIEVFDESMLVEDITNYALGPHTDAPSKVVTALFYLPKDDSQSHMGTSIYVPTDRNYRCEGGPHYERKGFERVATMPFLPNALFAFVKSDKSFHGVEPVTDPDVRRWLLLYDIKFKVRAESPQAAAAVAQPG